MGKIQFNTLPLEIRYSKIDKCYIARIDKDRCIPSDYWNLYYIFEGRGKNAVQAVEALEKQIHEKK